MSSEQHEEFVRETTKHIIQMVDEYEVFNQIQMIFNQQLLLPDGRIFTISLEGEGDYE